jgi:DNA-binding MarR family transcriptional regulator
LANRGSGKEILPWGELVPSKKDREPDATKVFRDPLAEKDGLEPLKALLLPDELRPPIKLTEDHVRSAILVRRARAGLFGENLFFDPAWDILLELHAAALAGRDLTLSELIRAIDIPRSTALRWVAALERLQVVESSTAVGEADAGSIRLSTEARSKMERLTNHWGSAFVSIRSAD